MIAGMSSARIVSGRLVGPTRVELDEPVAGCERVEVIVRDPVGDSAVRRSVIDVVRELPPGHRTREDIDRQVAEERAAWNER